MEKYKEIFKNLLKSKNIKFLAVLIVAGIIILSLPDFSAKDSKNSAQSAQSQAQLNTAEYTMALEERLKTIIQKIEGVGNCEIMVTLQNGTEYVFANETRVNQTSSSDTGASADQKRVSAGEDKEYKILTVNDGEGGQKPIVIKENQPKVMGVLIACDGGGNDVTVYKITEALKTLFDIPSNKVCVIKLKK